MGELPTGLRRFSPCVVFRLLLPVSVFKLRYRATVTSDLAGEALHNLTAALPVSADRPEGDSSGLHLIDDGSHDIG